MLLAIVRSANAIDIMKKKLVRNTLRACAGAAGSLLLGFVFSVAASNASNAGAPDAPAPDGEGVIIRLTLEGAVGPAMDNYVRRALNTAKEKDAAAVVMSLDTPGGIMTSMRAIVRSMMETPFPVIVYVAPEGARASSAGTFIVYASHIAAMAPGTHIGAATPVAFGSAPSLPEEHDPENAEAPESNDAMERKIMSDTVAFLRALAERRERNVEWAEQAVREGASLTASEALQKGVINVVADDWPALLETVDGMRVTIDDGEEIVLSMHDHKVMRVDPDWRTRLLYILTNPNVAYVLMLVGIYGLMMELANPGELVPGITGSICLILALFAFHLLPVNYAGMALIIVGLGLMTGEAFVPSFGALGIGGGIAFLFGSIILLDTDVPGLALHRWLIAAFTLLSAFFFIVVFSMMWKAWRRPVVSGRESMQGAHAVALEDFEAKGRVRLQGESWAARTREPVRKGQTVRVTKVEDLQLVVEPETSNPKENPS